MFEELESKRRNCANLTVISIITFVISFLTIFLSIAYTDNYFLITLGFLILIFGFVLMSISMSRFSKLKKEFKISFLKKAFEERYPGCTYIPDKGLNEDFAVKSRIIPKSDRYSSNDLIFGEYDGVSFTSADIHVEERHTTTDSKGHTTTTYVTIFKGRFFNFSFNKNFKATTVVNEKGMRVNISRLSKIELENPDFNKKFKIHCEDEHTAFYILTPQLMDRMLEIESSNKGKCAFSFIDSNLNYCLNNNIDTFELSLFKRIDGSILDSMKKDLDFIKTIIETLKINESIFK